MEKVVLEAKLREKVGTSSSKNLRVRGFVPAVLYGKGIKPIALEINLKNFINIISKEAGRNVIIDLKISHDGKSKIEQVLTQDVQRDPLSGKIIHIDFKRIIMTEKIKTKVPVEIVGIPIGVKQDGGILVHHLREVEIKCLPGKIPEKFELDVTNLKIGDTLHVSDIKPEKDIEIVTSLSEPIIHIAPPTKEEELAPKEIPTPAQVPSEKGVITPEEEAAKEEKAKPEKEEKAPKEAKPSPEKQEGKG